mmetsp:Transcript_38647/g.84685  ORF Transcript_38647/g.84685 Transcript_38647/m.84685 type:complete len:157 (+) Transcript_38647:108-578(+)
MRRVDRLILGSPNVLRTISGIKVLGRSDNPVARDWMMQFAPGLRYSNPTLICSFEAVKVSISASLEQSGEGDGEEAEVEQAEAQAKQEQEEADAAGAEDAAVLPSPDDPDMAVAERVNLQFTDGTSHVMNLALYAYSHQVMQRIAELDVEKGLSTT